jgi:hypothetical protein
MTGRRLTRNVVMILTVLFGDNFFKLLPGNQ